jgi:hypothetical protein
VSNAISAVASLLWPLIVLVALVVFRNPLTRLIRQRDFTVKIAGQELSVSDLSQQQIAMITDLQKQVAELEKQVTGQAGPVAPHDPAPQVPAQHDPAQPGRASAPAPDQPVSAPPRPRQSAPEPVPAGRLALTGNGLASPVKAELVPKSSPIQGTDTELDIGSGPAPWDRWDHLPEPPASPESAQPTKQPPAVKAEEPAEPTPTEPPPAVAQTPFVIPRPKPSGVLWVSDHPEGNAVEIARLRFNNVRVDVARSTDEALERLAAHRYQLVVSDMVRVEHGRSVPDAGQQLVRSMRSLDQETPIAIYADEDSVAAHGKAARAGGANTITSSSYELSRELSALGLV